MELRAIKAAAAKATRSGYPLLVPTLADYPHLVAQLDRCKNGRVEPESIFYASNKKLWWRCPEGPDHVWAAVVSHRTTRGSGCPFCCNQAVSVTNALTKLAPAVARQWHPTRNGDLRPRDVVVGSHRRVWWKCPKGPDHEWRVTVYNRTIAGYGCPFCSGKRATAARNLAVVAPHLVSEWHPTKNGALRPAEVTPRSSRQVGWQCALGHEWRSVPKNRVKDGVGCPYCSGRLVTPETSLAALDPPWQSSGTRPRTAPSRPPA